MKIAVCHNLPQGGAYRVMSQQLKWLSAQHQVEEISLDFPLHGPRPYQDWQNFVTLYSFHRQIANQLNHGGYDLVLVHPDRLTQAPFLLRFLTIPSIYYCEEWLRIAYEPEFAFTDQVMFLNKQYESFTRLIRKRIDLQNTQGATRILTNSHFTTGHIKSAYHRDSTICYPGVDPQVFSPQRGPKLQQILFIGAPAKVNGFDLLPKIPSLQLKIIDMTKSPSISDAQLAVEYSSSLATICVSYNEPFGLVPIESMACGTPVIALREGGYLETIIEGKTGWLLPRSPQLIAQKFDYLASHPQLSWQMNSSCRQHVLRHFTWAHHFQILGQTINSIVHP